MRKIELKDIPDHDHCERRVRAGIATALERFIWENEPAGNERSEEFRQGLCNLLNEVTKTKEG